MKKISLSLILTFISLVSYSQTWSGTTPGNIYYTGGNVGIGTNAPISSMLQVGSVNTSQPAGYFYNYSTGLSQGLIVEGGASSADFSSDFRNKTGTSLMYVRGDGNVGIGTTNPVTKLDIAGSINLLDGNNLTWGGPYGAGIPTIASNKTMGIYFYPDGSTSGATMRILPNGNIGIGTIDPQGYKLAVNGNMIAEEVKVKLHANWPDYVFKSTYKLPSLAEIKTYIDQNERLPEMPSADEVEKKGVNLGEMVKLQTKKIEELTLYLIEKDKQVDELKKQQQNNLSLLKKVETQQTQLEILNKKLDALLNQKH